MTAPRCAVIGRPRAATELVNAVTALANAVTKLANAVTKLASSIIPSPNAMTAQAPLWLSSRVEPLRSRTR